MQTAPRRSTLRASHVTLLLSQLEFKPPPSSRQLLSRRRYTSREPRVRAGCGPAHRWDVLALPPTRSVATRRPTLLRGFAKQVSIARSLRRGRRRRQSSTKARARPLFDPLFVWARLGSFIC